jgi:zinc protease
MSFARRMRWLGRAGIPAALLFVSATDIGAQVQAPARSRPTASAASRAMPITSVEGITEYSLPNGLRFLLFPDQSKPTVTVNVTYLVGSRHEGYGEAGMAHLLEHLLFKGTPKYRDIPTALTSRGARRNGSTWYDRTNYFETLPASDANLDFALDLEADRMLNSFVAKKDLETEFSVVRNEFESRENNPFNVTFERMMSAAFRWHGYSRSPIGNKADLEQVPIERLQAFYRKYYQPDNALLVVAGKFDTTKAIALIENKFGRIPKPTRRLENGNILFATYTTEPTQDGERYVTVRRVGDAQAMLVGYHVPAGSHPDFAAVDVLADVLGNNPSGRLYKSLVDTKRVSMVAGFTEQLREPSMLMFGVQLNKDQSLDSARAVLEATVDAARTSPFTTEEVQRAKDALLRTINLTLNNSEVVGLSLSEWAARGDWRLLFLHRDRIEKVTPADVQRVASAYLKPSNRTVAVFIPTAQPDRADIPVAPNIAAMVADYKGRAVVQAGEAFDASPKNVDARTTHSTLPNGMHLTVLPKLTRGNNVVAQMVLRWGNEASLSNKGAIPTLAGGMLSRGTMALTRQQVQDSLAKLKAQVNINGTVASANVFIQTTRPNLIPVLELVAQQLRTPRFDADELEKLKKERLAQIEAQRSQPDYLVGIALQKTLLPKPKGHPQYTSTADEVIADINAVTPQDLKTFHETFYTTANADLALVGDFDAAEITAAATRLFGDWKTTQPYTRLGRTFTKTDSAFQSIETPDKANAFFIAAQNIVMRDDDPDYPALLMANHLLGGAGTSSRILNRLRTKEGISYGGGSFLQITSLDRAGSWIAQAIYAPVNVERLQQAFREEVDRALKDGFTAQEIDQLRTGYLQGRTQGRANDNELVGTLVARRFAGRTMTYDEELERKIAALTPDQINAALRKYIDPKQIVILRAGDFAKNPPTKATP